MNEEFSFSELLKKEAMEKKEEPVDFFEKKRYCHFCGVMLLPMEKELRDGKDCCEDCIKESAIDEKKPVSGTWYKPMPKQWVCSYCGTISNKVWIYSANGVVRCKNCIELYKHSDPDIF